MRDVSPAIEIWAGGCPAWRPRPGDLIMGAIVRDDLNATSTGPIVVVPLAAVGGQPLRVSLGSEARLRQFVRLQPRLGERVARRCAEQNPAAAELHVQLMAIDDPTWAVSDSDEQEAMQARRSAGKGLAMHADERWHSLLA